MAMSVMRDIYGRKGGGKGGRGGGAAPYEDPNTLQSRAIARFVDMLCEGPIVGLVEDGKSIYLDDVPIQNLDGSFNFEGVTWDTRLGLPFGAQTYLPGFPNATSETQIGSGGTKVENSGPGVVATINNALADAVLVKLQLPMLVSQERVTGNLYGTEIDIAIDVAVNGGPFVQVLTDKFKGKCVSPYQRDYRIGLPAGGSPWQVRVRRLTVDRDPNETGNPHVIKDEVFFLSYTAVVDTKFAYPHSALVGVQIDTQQFTGGAPTRSYDIKGLIIKIPSNYNPTTRVYTGDWDGTFVNAWSDNPAWCLYDLLTSERYGLGIPAEAIDPWKWDLYTISQYCDEMVQNGSGGLEPRYTCNVVLNTRQEAYAVINAMVSMFRGMAYWSSGAIRVIADMPRTPVKLVTNSNVVSGEFSYEGTALKARHTVAKVVWNDPSDAYRAHVEFVDDQDGINKYGERQIDAVAFGCTSRAQAIRMGRWILDTERTATESVHYRAGLDHADTFPGDIISIADENYAGAVYGGRTVSSTATSLTIDQPFTIESGVAYTLQVTLPNGSLVSRTLTNSIGVTSVLTWSEALGTLPLNGAVWAITSTSLIPRQFMVVSNTEVDSATYEVMAVLHDPNKYGRVERNLEFDLPPYSLTPTGPIIAPNQLNAVSRLYRVGSAVRAAAFVSWAQPSDPRVYIYEVQAIRPDHPAWEPIGNTSSTSLECRDTTDGIHSFRVRGKGVNGVYSPWTVLENVTISQNIPPSDIVGLETVYDPNGVAFRWKPVTDLNVDKYEVRRGATWDTATIVASQREITYVEKGLASGTYTYWVAAVTTNGLYSPNPASIVVQIVSAPAPTVSSALNGPMFILTWSPVFGNLSVDHYEIRYGDSWATGTIVATTKATTYTDKVNWGGDRKFFVAAVDVAGNVGGVGTVIMTINLPSAVPSITPTVIDNNVLLKWLPATAQLPIDHYELRKGPTWDAAESIGDKTGTFTSVFEVVSGTFTYWLAAVDSADNLGPPTSVTVTVSQPPDYVLRVDWNSNFNGSRTNIARVYDSSWPLALDFMRQGLPEQVSFSRASAAWYTDRFGQLVQADSDVPRFDYDPVTLELQGFLTEGSRTNSIRNNTMVGATAGSPGTAPTNWSITQPSGITRQIVGFGVGADGIEYIDIRWSGTASASGFMRAQPEPNTQVVASTGQIWTFSAFVQLIAGSLTGTGTFGPNTLQIEEYTSGGSFQAGSGTNIAPAVSALASQRAAHTRTLSGVSTQRVTCFVNIGVANGEAVDLTLRIGLPQLELGGFVSSPIKTSGSAVTRAADITQTTNLGWFDQMKGTFLVEAQATHQQPSGASQAIAGVCNTSVGTGTEIYAEIADAANRPQGVSLVAGSVEGLVNDTITSVTDVFKMAFAWQFNDFEMSANGRPTVVDSAGFIGSGYNRFVVGSLARNPGTNSFFGWIRRVFYSRDRVTGPELRSLSTLGTSPQFAVEVEHGLIAPVNVVETYQEHFDDNSWTSPQDQVTAGYPYLMNPSEPTAQYVEIFDYGDEVPGTLISVSPTVYHYGGTVGITITTDYSMDGISWITAGTGNQVFAPGFRYIRVTLDFTSDGVALCRVSNLKVKLHSKLRTDSGTVLVAAADVGGTVVRFQTVFQDVQSIVVTPRSTGGAAQIAIYDFTDVPDPTEFKILLFNTAGTRINGEVGWSARGY